MLVSLKSILTIASSAAAALWFCGSTADAAVSLPDSCDTIEAMAAAEQAPRYYADKRHRQIMSKIAQNEELGEADLKALRRIRDADAKRHSKRTAAYAILSLDMAEIADRLDDTIAEGPIPEVQAAFDLLRSTARSEEEIETLLQLTTDSRVSGVDLQVAIEISEQHRSAFGPTFRHILPMSRSYFDDIEPRALITAGDLIERAGRELKSDRVVYRGKHMRLAGLNRTGSPDAAILAADLLPEAAARIEKSVAAVEVRQDTVRDCWVEQSALDEISAALPPNPELARLSMLNTMLFHQDGLHGVEFWHPFLQLVADKDQNPDGFREAMRLGSRNGAIGEADEATFALTAAEAMAETAYPALARTYYEAALSWSTDADKVDVETRLRALLGYARFEWTAGSSARVEPLVQEIDDVLAARSREVSSDFKSSFHAFKARLADARLIDDEVIAEVRLAIAEAIAEDKQLPPADPNDAQDDLELAPEEVDEVRTSKYVVDAMLREHLLGRFCQPCAARLREPLRQWWGLLLSSHNADEWNTSVPYIEFALATLLSESAAVDDQTRKTVSSALRKTLFSDSWVGPQQEEAFKALTSAGEAEHRALMLVGLAASLGSRDDSLEPIEVLEFLTTDDDETRAAMAVILAESIIDYEREFTGVGEAFGELDRSVRLVRMAGLNEAAEQLNYEIIRLAESRYDDNGEPDPSGEPMFSPDQLLQVAQELGAAHARHARWNLVLGNWKEADADATRAIDLMAARLRQDWRVGNERAVLLYRSFQPAIKLAAQIRFLLAADEKARSDLPGIDERVFEGLQFAMMGETAFASQAAVQKRLLEDHGAAHALRERDEAAAALERIEAIQSAAASSDEHGYQRRHQTARAAADEAEATLQALLPGAETVSALAPLSIEVARFALQPNEALLVLHSGASNLYGLVLRKTGDPLLFFNKSGTELLAEKIGRLRHDATRYGGIDIANAQDLYSRLIGPAETRLEGIDHLLVVADGQLLGLPWAALVTGSAGGDFVVAAEDVRSRGAQPIGATKTGKSQDLALVPWLIRKYPVSVLPGVASLSKQSGPSAAPMPFLGVGDPILGGSTPAQELEVSALRNSGGGIDGAQLAKLAPLPETAVELSALAASLGASDRNLLLRAGATEDRLRATAIADFRVVSFATHGILAGELGGNAEPGLVLTAEDASDASRDGYLSLSEIMALKFDAELVILSACNTGASDGRPRAEWMSGLTRGFISAGARNLLVTLWPIPSQATVRLMTGMAHEQKRESESRWPHALQRSILNMLDNPSRPEDRHPASWAAFVMFGRDSVY